uniref:Uncharacterized protein n=1 Tax=Arundo donax TaxID=35708 RepID=A0A0A9DX78_ARUDO
MLLVLYHVVLKNLHLESASQSRS